MCHWEVGEKKRRMVLRVGCFMPSIAAQAARAPGASELPVAVFAFHASA